MKNILAAALVCALASATTTTLFAQDAVTDDKAAAAELAQQLSNPVAALIPKSEVELAHGRRSCRGARGCDPRSGRKANAPAHSESSSVSEFGFISVPFQNNFGFGASPDSDGFENKLNFRPVVSITLDNESTGDWEIRQTSDQHVCWPPCWRRPADATPLRTPPKV